MYDDNPIYKNTADADNFDVTMAMRDINNNLIHIVFGICYRFGGGTYIMEKENMSFKHENLKKINNDSIVCTILLKSEEKTIPAADITRLLRDMQEVLFLMADEKGIDRKKVTIWVENGVENEKNN